MAGRKCALCSACGGAFHPACLQPPVQNRPHGSTPGALHGKNTWVCFHCECALPVMVAPGEDDPEAMARLEWTSKSFKKPAFAKTLREFWEKQHARAEKEHARAAREYEERRTRSRKRLEEKKMAEKDVSVTCRY